MARCSIHLENVSCLSHVGREGWSKATPKRRVLCAADGRPRVPLRMSWQLRCPTAYAAKAANTASTIVMSICALARLAGQYGPPATERFASTSTGRNCARWARGAAARGAESRRRTRRFAGCSPTPTGTPCRKCCAGGPGHVVEHLPGTRPDSRPDQRTAGSRSIRNAISWHFWPTIGEIHESGDASVRRRKLLPKQ